MWNHNQASWFFLFFQNENDICLFDDLRQEACKSTHLNSAHLLLLHTHPCKIGLIHSIVSFQFWPRLTDGEDSWQLDSLWMGPDFAFNSQWVILRQHLVTLRIKVNKRLVNWPFYIWSPANEGLMLNRRLLFKRLIVNKNGKQGEAFTHCLATTYKCWL